MVIVISGIIIFILSVLVVEIAKYGYRLMRNPDHKTVKRKLKNLSSNGEDIGDLTIVKNTTFSEIASVNRLISLLPGIKFFQKLAIQANTQYSVGHFLLLITLFPLTGFLGFYLTTKNVTVSALLSLPLATFPLFYLRVKKNKRMKKFERQLPDALDLIARALKAGHAFTNGLKLAGQEFEDPLGTEFSSTLDEINFGVSVPEALKNLSTRLDCPDLNYFIVSVILQRETGGNLAEIIESSARIIRERFKLQGKIRTLSAEGKLTASVLIALPFCVIIVLRFVQPEYIKTLFTEPDGRIVTCVAALMITMGILVIKSMIKIDV
jgi:tight adherence protein B